MKKPLLFILTFLMLFTAACSKEPAVSSNPSSSVHSSVSSSFDPEDVFMQSTPDSTCFSEIGYDRSDEVLIVTFRGSGASYMYSNVPVSVWNELKNSRSMGSYYNSEIKGQYRSERLYW